MTRMFTNFAGKDRAKFGMDFWAWDCEDNPENHCVIEVEDGGYEVEDLGLYHITDLNKVNWLK